ncbi:DUF2226 domain-containing protein [Methanococcus maripaludis]|uniref:Uncharacterized protein n=2 Tax=Methanococcus maripaludis TaxID=39152 RepID=A0A7J9PFI0_METMI|nr:DUF2226 domain-containing protein [Methanococcus maripaludis]MBA2862005.1 hypothetical protein [Methanococcus maripaludis]
MDIIEGKFVKMGSNYKELFDELPDDFLGHIRLSLKSNGQFKESHLFLKDKKIIAGYSEYEGEFFGNDAILNAMKMADLGAIVDIFSYTDSMLSMMQNSDAKLFSTEKPVKKSVVEKKKVMIANDTRISVPEGSPIKLGASGDFEKYFGRYTLVELFKKSDGNYLRGYITYDGRSPIAAVYQAENKLTFGDIAFEIINRLVEEDDNAAIDVYEYSKSKLDYFVEEYPESVLSNKISEPVKTEKKAEVPNYVPKVEEIEIEEDLDEGEAVEVEEEISREELMKKLGLRTPDDEMIEDLLEEIFEPSKTEINAIESELLEKINKYLEESTNALQFDSELSIEYSDEGEFIAKCFINTTSDGEYGVKSAVDPKIIKKDITNIFDSYVIDIIPEITIINQKSEKPEPNYSVNKYEIDLEKELNKIKTKHSEKKKTESEQLKEKIERGIYEYLENVNDISEFEVHMSLNQDNGNKCKCSIVVVPKKLLGFIKGSLNTDKIKKEISEILTMNNVEIEFLNITVEKFTTSYSKYR